LHQLRGELLDLSTQLNGESAKQEAGEKTKPNVGSRLFSVNRGIYHSTYGPTQTNIRVLEIAETDLKNIQSKFQQSLSKMSQLSKALTDAGAPWIEGDPLPDK
jgi:hypothetical protein